MEETAGAATIKFCQAHRLLTVPSQQRDGPDEIVNGKVRNLNPIREFASSVSSLIFDLVCAVIEVSLDSDLGCTKRTWKYTAGGHDLLYIW